MEISIPTPHITAKINDVAKTVLMPGDPLRAKFIAEHYLTEVKCFNEVRNMLGFTGNYKGKPVSVMGSGMGMPSMGIYSYELFNLYNVEKIIRIGSSGALSEKVKIRDIVIAQAACTNSRYGAQFKLPGTFAPIADFDLAVKAYATAMEKNLSVHVGNILSSDLFYDDANSAGAWQKMGVLCTEMETAALYMNAARAGKKALSILTVSDSIFTPETTTAEERETSFTQMMELALEII